MPIRILDAATVGRIAAGEVVERPASVVKELFENALDAGAKSITVEVRGGGIDFIRVTDNGCGIEPGQVRLAFENHATSKLSRADQLDDIRTMGFRGEALPSIAAVSKVEMTTRAAGEDSGMRLTAEGGANMRLEPCGCPEGTTMRVRELFFNVPVRRAFLKKPAYEGGLVADVVARLLIGNPQVAVRYISNGQTVYRSYGDGNLRHAVFAVYGRDAASGMIDIDAAEGGTRLRGLVGIGDLARPSRAQELFFINGRSIRSPLLSKALERTCVSRVTIGLYPMCALHLTLPPASVDVNVHPNKLEVRFRDEERALSTVQKLLSTAFEGERVLDFARDARPKPQLEQKTRVLPVESQVRSEGPALDPNAKMPPLPGEDAPMPGDARAEAAERPRAPLAPEPTKSLRALLSQRPSREAGARLREEAGFARPVRTVEAGAAAAAPLASPPTAQAVADVEATLAPPEKDDYRLIGVAFDTYIFIETGDAVLIIDQHAAHERLRYEAYRKALEQDAASQMLLTPLILDLSRRERAILQDNASLLREAGYEIEPFGEREVRVTAVPFVLGRAELRPIFLNLLESLGQLKSATLEARRDEIMQMSCKGAVKGGDRLTDGEIRALIDAMRVTGAPPTCPHGRPVVRALTRTELEKLFRRIQ